MLLQPLRRPPNPLIQVFFEKVSRDIYGFLRFVHPIPYCNCQYELIFQQLTFLGRRFLGMDFFEKIHPNIMAF